MLAVVNLLGGWTRVSNINSCSRACTLKCCLLVIQKQYQLKASPSSGFDRVLIIGLISKSNTEQNTKNEIQFKAEVQSPTKKQ